MLIPVNGSNAFRRAWWQFKLGTPSSPSTRQRIRGKPAQQHPERGSGPRPLIPEVGWRGSRCASVSPGSIRGSAPVGHWLRQQQVWSCPGGRCRQAWAASDPVGATPADPTGSGGGRYQPVQSSRGVFFETYFGALVQESRGGRRASCSNTPGVGCYNALTSATLRLGARRPDTDTGLTHAGLHQLFARVRSHSWTAATMRWPATSIASASIGFRQARRLAISCFCSWVRSLCPAWKVRRGWPVGSPVPTRE